MTSAEEYYEAIKDWGAGSLYYMVRKANSEVEFVLEPVIIDTKNKDLTINILKRVMTNPDFVAFPGTPEMSNFINEGQEVGNSNNK